MACGVHWALSLVTIGVENLFLCLLAVHVPSFTDVSKSQGHILFGCLYFYYGAVRVLYISTSSLSYTSHFFSLWLPFSLS